MIISAKVEPNHASLETSKIHVQLDEHSTYICLYPNSKHIGPIHHSQEINNAIWVDYLADGTVYGVQLFPGMPKDFDND